ncbi:MAG: glycosyltransferase [Anaerolineales bacterium]|nr:glycosyltransferase [Chloroflexota bacterium]MBL6980734.1 glycosyltransferase [Anaerolineales bacterium]
MTNKREMDFSIILPVYNQADHITQVIDEYVQTFENIKYSHEFILVINNSNDRSIHVCEQLTTKYNNVHSVNLESGGWGNAVKAGLRIAQGRMVCYTNSARTSPENLALLVLYGAVNEDRVIKANRKNRESVFRRLGSLVYNLECRALFDVPFWDINGTPKVFPRSFPKLFDLARNDDLIDLEFSIICKQNDYPMIEVPIFSQRRHGGKSTTNISSAIRMYLGAFLMWLDILKGEA